MIFVREEGGGGLGRIFYGEDFPLGGKFSVLKFPRNILHRRNLPEFVCEIPFISLTFSLATPFYRWR